MAIAIVIFCILAKATLSIWSKAGNADAKLGEAQKELDKLKSSQEDLSAKVAYLSTDSGKENEVRTKYHAIKDGESVAVIVDDSPSVSPSANQAQAAAAVPSWWQKILRMIGL